MSEIQNKPEFSICSTQDMIWVKREHTGKRKKGQGTKNDVYLGIQNTHFRMKTVINLELVTEVLC